MAVILRRIKRRLPAPKSGRYKQKIASGLMAFRCISTSFPARRDATSRTFARSPQPHLAASLDSSFFIQMERQSETSQPASQPLAVGARPLMDTPAASSIDYYSYQARWEDIWSEGLQPGEAWDKKGASPAMLELLSSKDVRGKRVLVPGCGRGYDLVAFAEAGAECVVGLEISEHAMQAAESFIIGSTTAKSSCTVKLLDFLQDPLHESFDIGYDYTMLCALHPSLRDKWAEAWTRAIRSGGELIALVYPDDPQREAENPGLGPPYTLQPHIYDSLLSNGWRKVQMDRVPPELSHTGRQNKEWIGIYSRF